MNAEMLFDHQLDLQENKNVVEEDAFQPMRRYLSNLIDSIRKRL